jgi:hypothetical protein
MTADTHTEKCTYWNSFVKQQIVELARAIADTKWYLSEDKGDVGEMYARTVFREKYHMGWALNFRTRYCTTICPLIGDCDFYRSHLRTQKKINGLEEQFSQDVQ